MKKLKFLSRKIVDACTFATKNSVHLGRFRVKNATVRAGKRVHYGLRLYTRLFGVRNATVWGYFCDFMGFCNIMFEVVFLFFAFWVCTFEGSFCTCLSLFFHLFQFIFPPVSVHFCNCFSSFLQLFQLSVLTFFGGKKNVLVWFFDFFGWRNDTCTAEK